MASEEHMRDLYSLLKTKYNCEWLVTNTIIIGTAHNHIILGTDKFSYRLRGGKSGYIENSNINYVYDGVHLIISYAVETDYHEKCHGIREYLREYAEYEIDLEIFK